MATLKVEVERVREDVSNLLDTARDHAEVSSEYLEKLEELQQEAEEAIVRAGDVTQAELIDLQAQVAELRTDLARSLGMAALVIRTGQERIAKAIESAGDDDALWAAIIGGMFRMVGSAVFGGLVAAGIHSVGGAVRDAADAAKPDPTTNPMLARRQAALFAINDLAVKQGPLTFELIVERLSNAEVGIMKPEEARLIVTNLMAEDVLEIFEAEQRTLRLNRAKAEVKTLLARKTLPTPTGDGA